MGGNNHAAGAVEDAVGGVVSEVVEELAKVGIGEFGGCVFDAGIAEFGAGVGRVGKFLIGAIFDWGVAKRSVLGFG